MATKDQFSFLGGEPKPENSTLRPMDIQLKQESASPKESIPSGQTGLPWDTRGASFDSFTSTFLLVVSSPRRAFRLMSPGGGILRPMHFALVGMCVGGIGLFLLNLAATVLLNPSASTANSQASVQLGLTGLILIIGIPISMLGLLLQAMVLHYCLRLTGSGKRGFEATYRVIAYATGSNWVLVAIPFIGVVIQPIWQVCEIILGLAVVHESSVGRVVFAVLLPIFMVILLGVLLVALTALIVSVSP